MQIRSKVSPTSAVLAPSGQEKRDKGRQNPRRRRRSTTTTTTKKKKRTIKRGEDGRECFLFLAAGDLCARNRIASGNETTSKEGQQRFHARTVGDLREKRDIFLLEKKKRKKRKIGN